MQAAIFSIENNGVSMGKKRYCTTAIQTAVHDRTPHVCNTSCLVSGSLVTYAVRPTALDPFPEVYWPRGIRLCTYWNGNVRMRLEQMQTGSEEQPHILAVVVTCSFQDLHRAGCWSQLGISPGRCSGSPSLHHQITEAKSPSWCHRFHRC